MIRIKNKLSVFHDDNSSFTDHSNDALDFGRDTFSMLLNASDDYLYVGFEKPINVFYVELSACNTSGGSFTSEYWNGTAFTSIVGLFDETRSFARSGFVQWDRNQTDEASTTINSVVKFWYRFRPSITHTTVIVKGLNIVFSDDQDLRKENFEIGEKLPEGETSHILSHVAARDEIIQFIRNNGHFKQNSSSGTIKDITVFDLLDVGQIKLASTYLAMSKILFAVADESDDVFMDKQREYRGLYKAAIKTFYLDLDSDDDGKQDTEEKMASNTVTLIRR